MRETANRDHAAILDALEKRDVEAAVDAVLEHLQVAIRAFEQRTPAEARRPPRAELPAMPVVDIHCHLATPGGA